MPEVHPNPPVCLKKAQQDQRVLHSDFFNTFRHAAGTYVKPPYEISFAFSRTRHLIYVFFVAPAIRDVGRYPTPCGTAGAAWIRTTSFPSRLSTSLFYEYARYPAATARNVINPRTLSQPLQGRNTRQSTILCASNFVGRLSIFILLSLFHKFCQPRD